MWLSMACVYALEDHGGAGGPARASAADRGGIPRRIAATLTDRINEHAWDGEWYIYAINGEGEPIGSKDSPEGKIHLNVNTWAIFSGVAAAAGREEQVWKSIEDLATPLGHLLLKPALHRRPAARPSDASPTSMPGMFENGSIYTHGESFYLYRPGLRPAEATSGSGRSSRRLPSNYRPGHLDLPAAPAVELLRRPRPRELRREPLQQLHRLGRLVPPDHREDRRRHAGVRRPAHRPDAAARRGTATR